MVKKTEFLPITESDLKKRGWDSLDFILISGDAYVDHPSFGAPLIARYLEGLSFRVGILPQPDWRNVESFRLLGKPNMAFLVTSGNLDSMVSHYSAFKKRRKFDAYSPGGVTGKRPDRAVIVYTAMAKQAFKGVPVIIGGIEASLRGLSHYDFWSGKVRRSILLDSKADLLIYGMGENPIKRVSSLLKEGVHISRITDVRGTVCKIKRDQYPKEHILLPDFNQVSSDVKAFAQSFALRYQNMDPYSGKNLIEPYNEWDIIQNSPSLPLTRKEMDAVYALPFIRRSHPVYDIADGVPALEEVRFSITSSRGCFGGCSFCSLGFHQGRIITSRSHDSIIFEAENLIKTDGFKGYIHDVGGPTANFRSSACQKMEKKGGCPEKQCLFPGPCTNLKADHEEYRILLQKLRNLPGIKKVFIRSGLRYDYLLSDSNDAFLKDLVRCHVSGQLKVAPEHVSARVLKAMGKPGISTFLSFNNKFQELNLRNGLKQYIIPYFISSHPGSGLKEAIELALFLKKYRFVPDQIQDFYPTPGTMSTCMFHTGLDPRTMEPIYVAKTEKERQMQRALLHFHKKKNHHMVREALKMAGRADLIGKGLLVPPGR